MIDLEWNDYWEVYATIKYPMTIFLCLVAGFLAGYRECKSAMQKKQRELDFKIAIINTVGD